jgi:hypothetical protein
VKSFCLNQPLGPQQDDVPGLLRRLADEIEKLGLDNVVWHVFVHRDEVNERGDWPQATVYFDGKSADRDPQRHLRAVRPGG